MGLSVIFVGGMGRCGKSAVVDAMIKCIGDPKPHYLRLVATGSKKRAGGQADPQPDTSRVATARWVDYDARHVFEILPDALTAIYQENPDASVVIEADADPNLRHAYPYDHRIFVMPAPPQISTVFRDPEQAAGELRRALDDTAAFASEIYGLFADDDRDDATPSEPRSEISTGQMRGFLYSPLGDELATRIQLQQPYHGLVESDIIVVNNAAATIGLQTEECLRRIKRLLQRVRGVSGRHADIFLCNPADPTGRVGKAFLKALKTMSQG